MTAARRAAAPRTSRCRRSPRAPTARRERSRRSISRRSSRWRSRRNGNWTALGADGASLAATQILVTDLGGDLLAFTTLNADGSATITLDDDGTGHGWFVDPTPGSSTEFPLAVSAEEQAAVDGPAARRMDLLSVLEHEYGHVLQLTHVNPAAAPHSVMRATIDTGVRRVPVADDLVRAAAATPLVGAQWLRAVGVTNGTFDDGSSWSTRGSVSFTDGQAVLAEDARLNSRISQSFLIPDGMTTLAFDLVGASFDPAGGGPADAFEVALLDADTLAPLVGTVAMTHTDSLLNIQADGRIARAPSVTVVGAPGGLLPAGFTTRVRVFVDISSLAPGSAATLSLRSARLRRSRLRRPRWTTSVAERRPAGGAGRRGDDARGYGRRR